MSQLTFDGFTTNQPETTPTTIDRSKSWYQGRVLSHSSVAMYRTCPQRWKLRYLDKVPEKPRSFFSFGKSVHAGLEFLFEKIGQPRPSLEEMLEHYKTTWLREGYETAAQEKWFYQEGERILRGFYAKHQNETTQVFQIEYKFTIDVDGVPVTGYIDRIDSTPKGGLALIDYKTGKAFDKARVRQDPQLTLYQMACQEIFKRPVETVTLYHLNSFTPLTVPAHGKAAETDVRAAIVEAARGISEQKFDPKPDERGHCQWCDYAQICPAFAGRKPPTAASAGSERITELADRYGKIDAKLNELVAERATLGEEIKTHLRLSGSQKADGKYFAVELNAAADDPAGLLSVAPKKDEGVN